MENLAIVIPAYKTVYFKQVLETISNQTCKDFTLYIGIDGSSDDFKTLIEPYTTKISIVYKYFDNNLGKRNLVAHWERCIDMTKDEEWIWLFSDDDIMENTCVEDFYKTLPSSSGFDLFHFNILKINEQNIVTQNCFSFPEIYTSEEFLKGRLKGLVSSVAIEYIFKKKHFMACNRFQNFDLAWGSDDATWIKLSKRNGFKTIKNSKVYWRLSSFNISSEIKDTDILYRKLNSQIQFANWALEETKGGKIQIEQNYLRSLLEPWFIGNIKQAIRFLSFNTILQIVSNYYKILYGKKIPNKQLAFLYFYQKYSFLKNTIKSRFPNIKNYFPK
jgi:hypothetical protein